MMIPESSSRKILNRQSYRQFPTRREVLAAASAALASTAAGSSTQAAVGSEGYYLAFHRVGNNPKEAHLDRLFFIPSAWLELFELTDIYKARYPDADWNEALRRIRLDTPSVGKTRRHKISALYSDSMELGTEEPFPGATVIPPVPPGSNQTYLAQMVAPADLPE